MQKAKNVSLQRDEGKQRTGRAEMRTIKEISEKFKIMCSNSFLWPSIYLPSAFIRYLCILVIGLPRCCSGKESACQHSRCRFDPCVGKMPWRRKWQSTPVFLPGNSMDGGAWRAMAYEVTKSQTWLRTHASPLHPCNISLFNLRKPLWKSVTCTKVLNHMVGNFAPTLSKFSDLSQKDEIWKGGLPSVP